MNLDQLWKTAVAALHSGRGITRADLDAFVYDRTKGQLTSFAELAHARARAEEIAQGQEQQDITTPSAGGTAAEGAADAAGLGLASRIFGPENPFILGAGNKELTDYQAAGAEAHPKADFFSRMGGGAAVGALGGAAFSPMMGAAVEAVPGASALPGLVRTGIAGGLAQAPIAGAQAVGAGGGFKDALSSMAWAAAMGMPLSMAATWKAAAVRPGPHMAGQAVQEAAPGVPNLADGVDAIRSGTTTPPATQLNTRAPTPLSDAAAGQLPPVLRPLNVEKSPSLRGLASKIMAVSFEAGAQARHAIVTRLSEVVAAMKNITRDLTTGYDALLKDVVLKDPRAAAILKAHGVEGPVDAAVAFNLQKQLAGQSNHMYIVKAKGSSVVDIARAEALGADADVLREILGKEVGGFNDLQSQVGPYLQRQDDLKYLLRSILGRALRPQGKAPEVPKGGLSEGVKESYGLSKPQITEEMARELVGPLFRSSETEELLKFIRGGHLGAGDLLSGSKYKYLPGAKIGAIGGAAQSQTKLGKKVRRYLDPFFPMQQE